LGAKARQSTPPGRTVIPASKCGKNRTVKAIQISSTAIWPIIKRLCSHPCYDLGIVGIIGKIDHFPTAMNFMLI
jgi:hypothetical protein